MREATIIFIQMMNNIFDIMESKSQFGHGYKKGMCLSNILNIRKTCHESNEYIERLRLPDNQYISKSWSKVGFPGFIVHMVNFLFIGEDVIQNILIHN